MFLGSDRPHPGSGIGLIRKAGAGVYHFVWSSSKPELLAPRPRPRAGRLQAIIREDDRERFGVNGVEDEVELVLGAGPGRHHSDSPCLDVKAHGTVDGQRIRESHRSSRIGW